MSHELIKLLDRLAGSILVSLLGGMPRRQETVMRSILVIRPGGIGDAVLLLPMLMRLSQRYPDATIDLLAERRNAEVFAWSPVVSEVRCYDRPSDLPGLFRQRYDLIIDTEQWYRLSAVFARLLRSSRLIGFAGNGRERLLNDWVPYDLNCYEADMFCALLHLLGVDDQPSEDLPFFRLPEEAHRKAVEIVDGFADKPLVAVFPGASVPEKRWPVERFVEVAKAVASNRCLPVVVGGVSELAEGERIAAASGGVSLAGRTSLSETVALLARCSLLLSGDSGLLHAAAMLEIPTIALFGPSNIFKWAPKGEKQVIISHAPACAPCSRYGTIPPCSEAICCMHDITVEEVQAELNAILASKVY